MRVLTIHNRYKHAGGEDVIFQTESDLLERNGNTVDRMLFDNRDLVNWQNQVLSGLLAAYNPSSARAIQLRVNQFAPEVIHVYNFMPLLSPSVFFVANRNDIPVVFTVQNYRLLCPSATLFHDGSIYERSVHSSFPWDAVWKGVYRNSVIQTAAVAWVTALHNFIGTWQKRIDRYILPTEFVREKFASSQLGIPAEKLAVKPNCVEYKGKGPAIREDFFLFVGRLTEEKGLRTLLNAAGDAGAKLVVIGDGPLRELVKESASTNRNLTYLGFQDSRTVFHYLQTCKALIFPSIWYEGLPMTILEAFSAGTPVLASKLGSMAEVIQDGMNGIHFEPGNVRDLVKKIMEINESPDFARKIGEGAYSTYKERYTPETNYCQLMEIYSAAKSQHKRGMSRKPTAVDRRLEETKAGGEQHSL